MVKTGLTASVIVSQWTWAATLLQSSNVACKYGVSGPFWWVQLFLFDKTRCHISYVLFIAIWHTSHICALIHCCIFYPPYLRYASGATIQVLLFGVLAISLKDVAPSAHTMCEIVRARWGKGAHITFLFFALMANIIVTSMLLLGGAATVEALTGMKYELASFLIPWGGKFDHITCTML